MGTSVGLQLVGEPRTSNDTPSSQVFSYTTYTNESTESSTADCETENECGSFHSMPTKALTGSLAVDNDTEHGCAPDEDTDITFTTLAKKMKQCRRRNKELSLDYKEQQKSF